VVPVVGSHLGSPSHTLTAVEAPRVRAIAPAVIVVSESREQQTPLTETAQTLAGFLGGVSIVAMPRVAATQIELPQLARFATAR
jgi:dethiobiotin synthetase